MPMFLVDRPHVSAALRRSLAAGGIPVVATAAARERLAGTEVDWIPQEEAARQLAGPSPPRLHTNSEDALAWLAERAPDSALARGAGLCKDKLAFRELTRPLHPELRFLGVGLEELDRLDLAALPVPFVIKPAAGFFSLGVHRVSAPEQWPAVRRRLRDELQAFAGRYPGAVLDSGRLIVEQLIDGAEFALDAYLDDQGEPVILNLMEHVFAGEDDVSDRVYRTTPALVERWRGPFADWLRRFGALAELRGFSLHAELRVDEASRVTPIEVNPLRFGGFCTTAELTARAWGFDPYQAYLRDERPDWPRLLAARGGRAFHLVVLDDTTGVPAAERTGFDYQRLLARFRQPLALERIDPRAYPLFGFLVAETPDDDFAEVDAVLRSDLREFVQATA